MRNLLYHISKPFKHGETYFFLDAHSTLLQASDVCGDDRPIGTKKAKEAKEDTNESSESDVRSSAKATLTRIETLLASNAETN